MFFRMIHSAESMILICERRVTFGQTVEFFPLDYYTVASIARSMLDASIMLAYVTERVTAEEFDVRRRVIELHASITRYKMFKNWGEKNLAEQWDRDVNEQRRLLEAKPFFNGLDGGRRQRILAGMDCYIHGLRGAVRQLGWDKKQFDAAYAYLSAHTHSAPVSFIKTTEHGISSNYPSPAQFAVALISLDYAIWALSTAGARILQLFPDVRNKLSPDEQRIVRHMRTP